MSENKQDVLSEVIEAADKMADATDEQVEAWLGIKAESNGDWLHRKAWLELMTREINKAKPGLAEQLKMSRYSGDTKAQESIMAQGRINYKNVRYCKIELAKLNGDSNGTASSDKPE